MARLSATNRKSIADLCDGGEAAGHQFQKSLGGFSITAMGIGAIIGAGIFVLTGTAAAKYAGPGIMLSFVIGGIACAFVALCYAELAAMIPVCGSAYTYTYATLGQFFAWVIGWDLILEYSVAAATVAVGWSGYVVSFLASLGISVPPELANAPGTEIKLADGSLVHGMFNLPAALVILLLTALLILGTRQSSLVNNFMVALKLFVVLAFIAMGVSYVNTDNWSPLIPENTGEFGHYGWSGILRGASVVFFAFIGFDAVSTAAQEARRPQRDMPIGILLSLFTCTLLYIAVSAVMTGLVPYSELNVADPVAKAIDVIGAPWASIFIKIGAIVGLTTVMLVMLFAQTRIFFTMAHDGLLPRFFAAVHPRFKTPWLSQALIGILIAVLAALVPIGDLGELVSIGTLFAFALVSGAVIYLRRSEPDRPRPFRTPFVPLVPILGILSCLALMAALPPMTWLRLFGWLALGLVIYFTYSRYHAVRHGGAA